jgi:hypothetical protein
VSVVLPAITDSGAREAGWEAVSASTSWRWGGRGCKIYGDRPFECRVWSCGWLLGAEYGAEGLKRPDRSHLVVDPSPDFIRVFDGVRGEIRVPVLQVWVDPRYSSAHVERNFRAFARMKAEAEGLVTLLRFSSSEGYVLAAPSQSDSGDWMLLSGRTEGQHSAGEIVGTLAEQGRFGV